MAALASAIFHVWCLSGRRVAPKGIAQKARAMLLSIAAENAAHPAKVKPHDQIAGNRQHGEERRRPASHGDAEGRSEGNQPAEENPDVYLRQRWGVKPGQHGQDEQCD